MDADIVAHYEAGSLVPELLRPIDTNQQAALRGQLAALHNAGRIDLLSLTATSEFQSLSGWHFFTVRQVYCDAIPMLEAPPLAMLEMVQRLIAQGKDTVAPMPAEALRVWLCQAPERARAVVDQGLADPLMDLEILLGALVALGDTDAVMSLINIPDARRRAAIAALGGIKPEDEEAGAVAFATLVEIAANDPNEDMRFTGIFASFNLLKQCKEEAPKWVPCLVAAVTGAPSTQSRSALLQGLLQHPDLFETADARSALTLASDGDLTDDGLRGQLNYTLFSLLSGRHQDLVIDCTTILLGEAGKAMPLDDFETLEHGLTTLDRSTLFALAVRWFATGDRLLCQVVAKLVGGTQQMPPFDASLAGFGLGGSEMLVLCHKAVGYMIMAPVVAASLIVATLRAGDRVLAPQLEQLLLHGLLINYGGTVGAYLKGIGQTDIAYESVQKALKLHRRYEKGLDIKTPIKELAPSSYQRGVVRQNHYVMSKEIRKQAERQSVFYKLVQRSTILYGRSAQTYFAGADQPPHSIEMKTLATSFEMPRLQVVDPVGLDWLLQIFMTSKPK